ncbi:MAG TPA: glycosyltransferase [Melioribacteraceae bacterium]|nr:glycosyltransferase [Melioribacteraceae bacterium]
MFELILFISLCLYTIQIVIFIIGANKKFEKLNEEELPTASVIVAARNEQDNIVDCLNSLNNLNYPEGKLEIIIVDDNSIDKTAEIINEYIKDKKRFKYLKATQKISNLKGKANAIAIGINNSKGEIILTTDADCTVNKNWAKSIASYYKKDVGIVCGYTTQYDNSTFNGMQAADFIYLLTVAGGSMNLGKPLSAIGNNMSYRRTAYNEVGGYSAIPFSVTEDFKLLMSIHALKKYKSIYPLDENALVTSKPCSNIKSLFWQKKRWGVGGLDSDIVGYLVMASGFIAHLFYFIAPFLSSINIIWMLIYKIILDYSFIKPVYIKLKLQLKISHFLAFQVYFIIYVLLLPVFLLFGKKVVWKGRTY